ncbi:MAG: PD40 domain-containing protein [Bacteroidia bacterium]|nr:PD40 domain-containing protein [Bacteroidia bacterium]
MKNIFLILFIAFIIRAISAQPTEGSADAHFNDGNYPVALKLYQKLLKTDKTNPFFIERIGLCYLYADGDKTLAIPYLEQIDTIRKKNEIIHLELGKAYFYNNQFQKAARYINEYLTNPGEDVMPEWIEEAKHYLFFINNAEELMKLPLDVTFINLGENINSKMSDIYPLVTPNEREMVYTSNKRYLSDFELYITNVYLSSNFLGSWGKAKSVGTKINTDEDECAVGMSADGDVLLIYSNTLDNEFDILYSEKKKGKYKEALSIGKTINTPAIEFGATMTVNEDTLYFASDREWGLSGMDIYIAVRLPNGEFSMPQNLEEPIKSIYDENFPMITPNGKTLFFASAGHNSMGGYDIFTSEWDAQNKKWKPPVNFGYPINNLYDNEIISLSEDKRYGYISTYRTDSYGYRDIYKVIFNTIEAGRVVFTGVIAAGDSLHPVLLKNINPDITMKVFKEGSEDVYGVYSYNKNTDKYTIALPPGIFNLVIEGDKYETFRHTFDIQEKYYEEKIVNKNIYLKLKGQGR